MDALKRWIVLGLSAALGLAAAGGYAVLTWQDKVDGVRLLKKSDLEWVQMCNTLEICLVFYGVLFFSGRVLYRLLRAPHLEEVVRKHGNWRLKLLTLCLVLLTAQRAWATEKHSWHRFDDWFSLGLFAGFAVLAVVHELGPDANFPRRKSGGLFPGDWREGAEVAKTEGERRKRYEKAPRPIDDYLYNQLYVHRANYGTGLEFRLCKGRPSAWIWPLAAGLTVALSIGLCFVHKAFATLLPVGLGLGVYGVFLCRRYPRTVHAELESLARNGSFVLGQVVIANNVLWKAGTDPAPAAVVFSLTPDRRFDVDYLYRVAERVAELRSTESDPGGELHAVWKSIRDDYDVGELRLPARIAEDAETYLCDVIVNPNLLPDKMLVGDPFPMLVDLSPRKFLTMRLVHL